MNERRLDSESPQSNENLDEVLEKVQQDLVKPPSLVEDLRYAAHGFKKEVSGFVRGRTDEIGVLREALAYCGGRLPRYAKICGLVAVTSFAGAGVASQLQLGEPVRTVTVEVLSDICIGSLLGFASGFFIAVARDS